MILCRYLLPNGEEWEPGKRVDEAVGFAQPKSLEDQILSASTQEKPEDGMAAENKAPENRRKHAWNMVIESAAAAKPTMNSSPYFER